MTESRRPDFSVWRSIGDPSVSRAFSHAGEGKGIDN